MEEIATAATSWRSSSTTKMTFSITLLEIFTGRQGKLVWHHLYADIAPLPFDQIKIVISSVKIACIAILVEPNFKRLKFYGDRAKNIFS